MSLFRVARITSLSFIISILTMNNVLAQGEPPPEVRQAVSALMNVINTDGDEAITAFLTSAANPAWVATSGEAELVARLQNIRVATRGLGEEVNIEPAPDGVHVIVSGRGKQQRIAMAVSDDGVSDLNLLSEESVARASQGRDGAVHAHVTALEQSGHKGMDDLLTAFESRHFSEAYMAETTREQRKALLAEIRSVAVSAGAVMLNESNNETIITMRGPKSLAVIFKLEAHAPFGIDALRTEGVDDDVPKMVLSWKGAAKTFKKLEKEGFSGVVYLAQDGKKALEKAYGKSNRELDYDTQLDTIFGIGSTPIDFTVTGIYLLAQEGKLKLDDTIDTYLEGVPADKSAMTIRHLIDSQSGLPNFHGLPEQDWNLDLAWIDRETAVARILSLPQLFEPGSSKAHSHSAYGLAAAIIEIASSKDYFAFVRDSILTPAGMTRTGMYGQSGGYGLRDFAVGYAGNSVGVPNIPPNWGPTSWLVMGSGGMYSTMGDMVKFYEYVRSGNALEEEFAQRYRGEGIGVGGSDRGFYFFHANRGSEREVMMLINSEGRSPEIRTLSRALETLVTGSE